MDIDEHESNEGDIQGSALFHLEQTQWKEIGLQGQERRFAAPHTWLRQFIWDIQRNASERRHVEQERDALLQKLFASLTSKLRVVREPSNNVVISLKVESALPALADLGMQMMNQSPILLTEAAADTTTFVDLKDY